MAHRPEDLSHAILELGVEDYFGLWELQYNVAREVKAPADRVFRERLRNQLIEMVDRGSSRRRFGHMTHLGLSAPPN
jgi:hypothetical protein